MLYLYINVLRTNLSQTHVKIFKYHDRKIAVDFNYTQAPSDESFTKR